ncbi:MAG TPA: FAD-linked oxidase C-terminal domain-containing protein, partial [Thermodesulfobacteriota bacterium]|nr:FAD-linked oxidase C-terminal domain-containing protein [Thermodesulfobacteriota bacterium]
QGELWKTRESGVGASFVPGVEEGFPGWEDAAVAPERLGDYLRDFIPLLDRYGYRHTLYGHFGQGCIHTRITFDLRTRPGIVKMRSFMENAADLVARYGGSFSGEHGDGQARAELLPRMFGRELISAFRQFKAAWDPDNRMNPGKVVDPYRLDENLRLGADYTPPDLRTHFRFPADQGSFAKATERCFGVGKCRSFEGGTMCPSFRVTREEKHTTRGRARLLFEMMRGEVIPERWGSEHIRDALDLCLACKGCKGDCPASVDVASYKAEFLAHYYEDRMRPPLAYAMGYIFRWAALASYAPWLANAVLGSRLPRLLGFTGERPFPLFAGQTFQQRWERRGSRRTATKKRVILWPDTFNNHFHPETSTAALEVLENLSYGVEVPRERLCCGRPLFDFGMIPEAKRQLRRVIDALRPALRSGVPVVGLEPSCVSVFRDELLNLFPDDEDARRLAAQSHTLAEFMDAEGELRNLPSLEGRAVLHGHCHQKAIWSLASDRRILEGIGLKVDSPDAGCCGMGGSFGWERHKYDLSMEIGKKILFPAVGNAPADAVIVADGFSCRTQIEHGTGRRPMHLAEVIRLAMTAGALGPHAEERFAPPPAEASRREIAACAILGADAAGAALYPVIARMINSNGRKEMP